MTKTELLQTAKPILFNSEMVRAILDGRKTVTRRAIKPQPLFKTQRKFIFDDDCPKKYEDCDNIFENARYQVGDILYVRETWFGEDCTLDCAGRKDENECPFNRVGDRCYGYRSQYSDGTGNLKLKWRPSIHMPKVAARIFLRVTDVRAERLQDITEGQARKEGLVNNVMSSNGSSACKKFSVLWDSTIKKSDLDTYGWNANPWVWVYEFERIDAE